jgi:hypothetical protein
LQNHDSCRRLKVDGSQQLQKPHITGNFSGVSSTDPSGEWKTLRHVIRRVSKDAPQVNFDQNQSRIAELLNFSWSINQEDQSSNNGIFEHRLIILSDGRNIFSKGKQTVRNAVKMAQLQRMFIVYINDNPENKV